MFPQTAETVTDADYADNLAPLTNTPAQVKSLLHSQEQPARGIGLYLDTNKTEFMYFKREGDICILSGRPLKSVDQFTYFGSYISSTENDVNICRAKVLTAIGRLLIIWKSDFSDKINRDFYQAVAVSILLYRCTTWVLTKRLEKRLDANNTRMLYAV